MHDWKEVDLVIGRLARQRSGQDYEEGLALVAAKRTRAYVHFGFGSLVEYIERRLGYDPRTTNERLRVAEALEILPKTAEALRSGEIRWSTARELTRIAQPETEVEWLVAARAKTLREIERLVAGLRPGDRPGAPSDPDLIVHVLRFDLKAPEFAMARGMLDRVKKELGDPGMSDADALVAALQKVEGAQSHAASDAAESAPFQTAATRCDDCKRMWLESRGERIEVSATFAERVACDQQDIGRLDVDAPARATQTIPPATRRLVRRRAAGGCEVPGCRHRFGLEIHHLRLRSEGGTHDLDNLVHLCGVHHGRLHEGYLVIEGKPSTGLQFGHADGTRYGQPAAGRDPRGACATRHERRRHARSPRERRAQDPVAGGGRGAEQVLRDARRRWQRTRAGRRGAVASPRGLEPGVAPLGVGRKASRWQWRSESESETAQDSGPNPVSVSESDRHRH